MNLSDTIKSLARISIRNALNLLINLKKHSSFKNVDLRDWMKEGKALAKELICITCNVDNNVVMATGKGGVWAGWRWTKGERWGQLY